MRGLQENENDGTGLVGIAISAITAHMRTGEMAPGDKLPAESVFSKDLSVSRSVVREAFRSLAAMNLIELNTGKRATVAKLDYSTLSPVIEHGVYTEQISIQQIYDVRRTIEVRTATLAALRRSDAQAAQICAHAEAMKRNMTDSEKQMEHDIAFHLEIAKATKNPIFPLIIGSFDGVTRQTWPVGWRSRTMDKEKKLMIDLHINLAGAIATGNPERASQLMAEHFDESVRALIAGGYF